jgi:predicted DNA-binding ribbon-helix-helix protein
MQTISRKYPIGIQTFQKIREEGFLYIDKTKQVYDLANNGGYFFLSRPRRFGKSLLVSTLDSLFSGKKELFEGLWIVDKWDFSVKYQVLYIPFNAFDLRGNDLEDVLQQIVLKQAKEKDITLESNHNKSPFKSGTMLSELIQKLYEKTQQKVVVLIDEYDKPIIDFLEDIETAEQNRDILKSFYGVLKPADPYLKLVFLTGISKFSKISIFSDLNNLQDISLHKKYGAIAGLTQIEIEGSFSEEIVEIAAESGISVEKLLDKIKQWYNGYTWDLKEKVYNPFSILRFIEGGGDFKNFWFETGTPTFLVKQLLKHYQFDFTNLEATESQLNTFDLGELNPATLLFQTGYLTIKSFSKEDNLYLLDYPNKEVEWSLQQYLLEAFKHDSQEKALSLVVKLRNALQNKNIEQVIEILNSTFLSLPYDLWQKENEQFYHAILHLTFTLLGTYVQSEVHTSRGRCDAIVHTDKYIYALEFKLDKSANLALKQITDRGYLDGFKHSDRELIAIGINFSTKTKSVESWEIKIITQ